VRLFCVCTVLCAGSGLAMGSTTDYVKDQEIENSADVQQRALKL
jgi:hypothetical protein